MSDQLFSLLKGIFQVGNTDQVDDQRDAQIVDLKERIEELEKKFEQSEHVILEQNRTIGALALIQSSMLKEIERILMPTKTKQKIRMPVSSSRDDDLIN